MSNEMRIIEWSSDVCSSDLLRQIWADRGVRLPLHARLPHDDLAARRAVPHGACPLPAVDQRRGAGVEYHSRLCGLYFGARSEERRVGKECVSKCKSSWSPNN